VHGFEQKGLEGESLGVFSFKGSSSVRWAGGSSLAIKRPLTWYKVRTIYPAKLTNYFSFFSHFSSRMVVLYKNKLISWWVFSDKF
jgi:hypothetical protein